MVEDINNFNASYESKYDVNYVQDDSGGEMVFCMSNYQRDVLRMMYMMQSSQMLTDVILEVGSEYFSSHKLLLAAASPYFKAMFTGSLKESIQKDSRIRLHGICPTAMSKVLNFMYSGQIKISEHTVCQLLAASSMLQISDVLKACCVFLERQLAATNAIGIAKFAEQHGCSDLMEKAHHFILNNFTEVSLEEEFLQLNEVELIEFVRKDELNVKDEKEVYNAVVRWLMYDKEGRQKMMPRLITAVRCQYLTPTFIDQQVRNNLISSLPACREYLANIFKDLTLHKKVNGKERVGVGGRVLYIAGGFQRHSLDTFESYNPQTECWTTLSRLTVPRSGLGSAFVKGVLFAIGGRNNSVPGTSHDSDWVDRYDPARDLWRPCNPMSCPRHRVGVGVLDGMIYACGGSAGSNYLNTVERYDPDEDVWRPVASMHRKRIGSGVVVVNRILYTLGGFDGESRLSCCECYHPESDEWLEVASMAEARSGHGVAAYNNQSIYVFGGYDGTSQLNTVEKYNVTTQEWTYVSPMRHARSALSAATLGSHIYITGGYNQEGYISSVEIYDPEMDTWSMGSSLSFPRSGHTTCVSQYSHTSVSNIND